MIRLEHLAKAFGAKPVLRGLTLEVPDGRNTVIIGYSGTGKSVTLKLIVGLLEPDAGRVEVHGEVVHEMDRERLAALRGEIGYVFQFAALFDSMTVAENIRMGLVRRGHDEREIRERVTESLAVVELAGTEAKYPAELSGGMRKRVGIARAVNTGISAFVDPNGRVYGEVNVGGRTRGDDVEGYSVKPVYVDTRTSPYTRWGDWFAIGLALVSGLALLDAWVLCRWFAGRGRKAEEATG